MDRMQLQDLERIAQDAGIYPLRPAQTQALNLWQAGEDLLVVWPTGAGKSVCYQLPALVQTGLTLVISPLIALMEDQVAKARRQGWPMTCVHSAVSREDRARRLREVADGRVKLLYVTPERFRQPEFWEVLRDQPVQLLAVDEAHCISQWGHDFRPDYSRLGEIRERLGSPRTMALTATATKEVQSDILKQLKMPNARVLWEGVERPNLFLGAQEWDHAEEKVDALVTWLGEVAGAKIVYFTLIGTLEKTAEELAARGIRHYRYHGDLPDGERRRQANEFLRSGDGLMLATPAFGLGVDKPDIRGVAHFEIPGSVEAYFQEVGRAGRDGQPSYCRLFYVQEDLEIQMRFIESLTPDPDFIRATYKLLVDWKDRLNVIRLDDLREQLSFKNKRDYRLETALSYLDRWGVIRFPHRRLDRLEFLRELDEADLSPELWKARKLSLQKKLMGIVNWYRADACRKLTIYKYFGWGGDEPCGFCDWCEERA